MGVKGIRQVNVNYFLQVVGMVTTQRKNMESNLFGNDNNDVNSILDGVNLQASVLV